MNYFNEYLKFSHKPQYIKNHTLKVYYMSNSIYRDFATLLVNLHAQGEELPIESKGGLIAGSLGELRKNKVSNIGALHSVTYNHEEISFNSAEQSVLATYKYDQLPDFKNKSELIDFIESILRNLAY